MKKVNPLSNLRLVWLGRVAFDLLWLAMPLSGCRFVAIQDSKTTYVQYQPASTLDEPVPACQGVTEVGNVCPEGGIYAGAHVFQGAAFHYMTTPPGCTDEVVPDCSGTADRLVKRWSRIERTRDTDFINGRNNTAKIVSRTTTEHADETADAALYCDRLIFAGYQDWYLPSRNELNTVLYHQRGLLGGFGLEENEGSEEDEGNSPLYWSSSAHSPARAYFQNFETGEILDGPIDPEPQLRVRCLRKTPVVESAG